MNEDIKMTVSYETGLFIVLLKFLQINLCFSFYLDGYNESDLVLKWKKDPVSIGKRSMAQFYMRKHELHETQASYTTGQAHYRYNIEIYLMINL